MVADENGQKQGKNVEKKDIFTFIVLSPLILHIINENTAGVLIWLGENTLIWGTNLCIFPSGMNNVGAKGVGETIRAMLDNFCFSAAKFVIR